METLCARSVAKECEFAGEMGTSTRLAKRPDKAEKLVAAHGKIRVLAVGVSRYPSSTRLHHLPVASSDAASVVDRFLDIRQLNADPAHCISCTSKSNKPPTRGTIIRLLKELADADSDERILFYYSGHGLRIEDEFYIVPEDVYDATDPDGLISFERIKSILNGSAARQRIVILDACFSGRDVSELKALPANVSQKFLEEYLSETKGAAILSSSGLDQESTAQSPNPKLSLFTHFLCEGLAGAADALDSDRRLTLHSLYEYLSIAVPRTAKSYGRLKQQPVLSVTSQGALILGDFSAPVLDTSGLDLSRHPINTVSFIEEERAAVKDFLTNIRRWTYTQEHLEKQVNKVLPETYEDHFGKLAARLSSKVGMPFAEINTGEEGIAFPDGSYSIEYQASDKRTGKLRHTVWFGSTWFNQPDRMVQVLKCLELNPNEMTLDLASKQSLESVVAGLNARGWVLESNNLPHRFSASKGRFRVDVTPTQITFGGFSAQEILGTESDPAKASLIAGFLSLIPGSRAAVKKN